MDEFRTEKGYELWIELSQEWKNLCQQKKVCVLDKIWKYGTIKCVRLGAGEICGSFMS